MAVKDAESGDKKQHSERDNALALPYFENASECIQGKYNINRLLTCPNAGAPPKLPFCLVLPKWLAVKRSWWVPKLLPGVDVCREILILTPDSASFTAIFLSHVCHVT